MSFSSLEQNWFRWGDDLLFNFADCIDDDKFLRFVWRNRSNIYSKFIEFAKPESIFTCCASARANRRSDTHRWRHAHFQSIEPNFILKKTQKMSVSMWSFHSNVSHSFLAKLCGCLWSWKRSKWNRNKRVTCQTGDDNKQKQFACIDSFLAVSCSFIRCFVGDYFAESETKKKKPTKNIHRNHLQFICSKATFYLIQKCVV